MFCRAKCLRNDHLKIGVIALLLYLTTTLCRGAGPPPVLTVQPLDQTVSINDTVTFTVAATSGTTLSYQWIKNGVNIAGAANPSLVINSATKTDSGTYSVRVVNAGGTVYSSNAVLIVLGAPEITVQPTSQTVTPGKNISLSVAATGAFPLSYQWFFNGVSLGTTTNSTLARSNFNATFAGNYSVIVSNRFGSVTSSVAALLFQPWIGTYNGTGNDNDFLQATAVDASGNVYVTGYAFETASASYDYVTLKYDRFGNLLWRSVYDGNVSKDDKPVALTIDSSGNVYVTGSSQSSANGSDYVTVKYDSAGTQLWASRYNGSENKDDFATGIAVDKDGNVFVTGSSKNALGHFQYATIKYDSSGTRIWTKTYVGSGNLEDDAASIALDTTGNVYVTGKSKTLLGGFDMATIKYSNSGTQLWATRYSGDLLKDDIATKVVVDSAGSVYVAGNTQGLLGTVDYATIKYDSNGKQLWMATYNGPANRADVPTDIAVDKNGNVFVTGSSISSDSKGDYATVKYSTSGQQLWAARYDGGDEDNAMALALDPSGNVYVTGQSRTATTGYDVVTIKYSTSNGSELWNTRYNSAVNYNDAGVSLAVQDDYTVTVGAQANSKLDFTILKYQSQVALPTILNAPQDLTVTAGQPAAMTVVATGTGPLTYQWNRNGNPLAGATNSSLGVEFVRPADEGIYTITISNDFGAITSSPATLTVTVPPIVLTALHLQPTTPESGFSFAAALPRGITYVVLASSNGRTWTPVATNVTATANVIINDPDAKNYPCRFYRVVVH